MTQESWHEGKVALVTGGTSGIGLEIARTLSRRGARVAIGGRRAPGQYKDLQDTDYFLEQLDVCDTDSVERFVALVKNVIGTPDILVNSAGVSVHHEVCGHSDKDWSTVIETNLNGPFRMIRSCLPDMMGAGWGRIVNIASTAATTAVSTHAAYCASKAGLLGLTRAVALEGASRGVTCTAVSPTWVETEMLHNSMEKTAKRSGRTVDEERAAVALANPQNRLVQPVEIAELVSFLSSDLSPALTMEDIQLNAGAHW
jgi:NAD(P)-dependent dehydrogenase (short-subunit alcohol dehydrogenase family)